MTNGQAKRKQRLFTAEFDYFAPNLHKPRCNGTRLVIRKRVVGGLIPHGYARTPYNKDSIVERTYETLNFNPIGQFLRNSGLIAGLLTLMPVVTVAAEAPKETAQSPNRPRVDTRKSSGGSRVQPSSTVDPKKLEEAAHRFERALQLFDSGDNAGALAEFKRIFDLLPQPAVLYNIGLVYAAMARPVDAVDALERAINGGGLTPDQLERAKRTLADQQARIGRLTVTCKPEIAHIEVDSVEVAQTPLAAPIRISEGSHLVGAVADGYAPARKEVLIAGNAEASVNFELTPTQSKQMANITVKSRSAGADVFVDGKPLGKTPLATSITVAAGHHVVELRRAGYVATRRELDVGPGALGELSVDLAVNAAALQTEGAALVLDPSESPVDLTVDGERIGLYTALLRIPRGPHHLSLSSPGFLPLERDVVLEATQNNVVRVVFEPTPETRRNYKSTAMMHRTWGWVSIVGGAAIAGGGAVLAIAEGSRKSDAQAQLAALNAKNADGHDNMAPCDWRSEWAAEGNDGGNLCSQSIRSASNKVDSAKTGQTIGYVGIGVGAAVAVTGVILLVTGGPPDKYEHSTNQTSAAAPAPRLAVVPGPGQVGSGIQITF